LRRNGTNNRRARRAIRRNAAASLQADAKLTREIMTMNERTTKDLSKFGARERGMLKDLLQAWEDQGLPEDFQDDEVVPMMNMNSGNVFLTNSDFQVAMMNGDKLESFYSCPECGHEGFAEEMLHNENMPECQEYLKDIKVIQPDKIEED
jgi:hypothetical protein